MVITPEVTNKIGVQLVGTNSNAFNILSVCRRAILDSDVGSKEQKEEIWEVIKAEATSGDYDNLLRTMMKWFDVY